MHSMHILRRLLCAYQKKSSLSKGVVLLLSDILSLQGQLLTQIISCRLLQLEVTEECRTSKIPLKSIDLAF